MSIHTLPIACDLVAITAVTSLYFSRHQRRDLLLAYVALNVGVLSVTAMLTSASVGVGLGLGLFGVLSIIRLRSDSITQEEIAYYFVSLALGLLAGVAAGPAYLAPVLIGLLVLVMYVADHPRLLPRSRRQLLTLDTAIPDERALREHIELRLGVQVRHLIVQELDLVRDLTIVDLRYRVPDRPLSRPDPAPALRLREPAGLAEETLLAPQAVGNGAGWNGTGPHGTGPNGTGPNGTGPNGTGPNGSGPNGTGPNPAGSANPSGR